MGANIRYQGKFKRGDKVALAGGLISKHRVPCDIPLARDRPRTVVEVIFDRKKRANIYFLGSNSKGACAGEPASDGFRRYGFRSFQLKPWSSKEKPGRPTTKRRRKTKRAR